MAANITHLQPTTDIQMKELDEVAHDMFIYHAPSPEQIEAMTIVRDSLCEAFKTIVKNVPPSADRSAALRKLREARMDANSAIVHLGKY